jgi:Protein of unknown function (DUF4232)
MTESADNAAGNPPDPADAATDAELRRWADMVVPLSPPPYSFERVLVRAHRRRARRRTLTATVSVLCLALVFAGLAVGNLLPGLRQNSDCGASTNTAAANTLAVAKGSGPVNRRTEYVIGGLLAATALTGGILAGCVGGPSSPSSTAGGAGTGSAAPGGSSSSATSAPPTSAQASASSSSASSSATTTGTPQCHTADLSGSVVLVPGSQAMGSELLNITLTDVSGHDCTVYGFPGLKLEDKNQDGQATQVTWDPGVPKQSITLTNGSSASTTVRFDDDVPGSGEPASGPCEPASLYLQITPPNEKSQLVAAIDGTDNDGVTVCQNGALDVLALVPGTVGPNQ